MTYHAGCRARLLEPLLQLTAQVGTHIEQQQQQQPSQGLQHRQSQLWLHQRPLQHLPAPHQHSSADPVAAAAPERVGAPQRSLQQFRPSEHEKHAAAKHAAKLSGWHAAGVTLMCLLAMAVLGFMGYKAMQWYERVKRPGYVELQSLDNAFFRPTFTL